VLAAPILIVGWLMILVGVLLWRSMCEFFMAVLSIAEDLRYLRQFQEKLPTEAASVAPVVAPAAPVFTPQPVPAAPVSSQAFVPQTVAPSTVTTTAPVGEPDVLDTPFFQPRFGKRPD
jgi:hypothetical protein